RRAGRQGRRRDLGVVEPAEGRHAGEGHDAVSRGAAADARVAPAAAGLEAWRIRVDDLRGPEIVALLEEHLRDMYRVSPPESVHALDLDGLRQPEVTFWTLWDDTALAG